MYITNLFLFNTMTTILSLDRLRELTEVKTNAFGVFEHYIGPRVTWLNTIGQLCVTDAAPSQHIDVPLFWVRYFPWGATLEGVIWAGRTRAIHAQIEQ
jgi:hypothetical protein